MIIGLGIDIVELVRISDILERFGPGFTNRILHESERSSLPKASRRLVEHLAARFAAKEAGVKALGCGFSGGIGLHDVRIQSLPSGKPEIVFFEKALNLANRLGVEKVHLSLTHARDNAAAVVVLEGPLMPSPIAKSCHPCQTK